MAFLRRAVLATTIAAAGLAGSTGAAFATPHEDSTNDGFTVVDNAESDQLNQISACEIDGNVLGVQVNEAAPNVEPELLQETGDGSKENTAPGARETCNPSDSRDS